MRLAGSAGSAWTVFVLALGVRSALPCISIRGKALEIKKIPGSYASKDCLMEYVQWWKRCARMRVLRQSAAAAAPL